MGGRQRENQGPPVNVPEREMEHQVLNFSPDPGEDGQNNKDEDELKSI